MKIQSELHQIEDVDPGRNDRDAWELTAMIDLSIPDHAYFFGFSMADATLDKIEGKGRFTIEIQGKDRFILEQFSTLFSVKSHLGTRTRSTNFKEQYDSVFWSIHDLTFRQELARLGMPVGRKANTAHVPYVSYSEPDFFRGIIDGDGSLGITSDGFPFVSLVTNSDALTREFLRFLENVTGKGKTSRRNARDNAYNIAVYKEDAQKLVQAIYPQGCLCLPRKLEATSRVLGWSRPASMRKVENRKRWSPDQDEVVMRMPIEEAAKLLGRTQQSIIMRRWRLSQAVTS